jgi:hypothetical protein
MLQDSIMHVEISVELHSHASVILKQGDNGSTLGEVEVVRHGATLGTGQDIGHDPEQTISDLLYQGINGSLLLKASEYHH